MKLYLILAPLTLLVLLVFTPTSEARFRKVNTSVNVVSGGGLVGSASAVSVQQQSRGLFGRRVNTSVNIVNAGGVGANVASVQSFNGGRRVNALNSSVNVASFNGGALAVGTVGHVGFRAPHYSRGFVSLGLSMGGYYGLPSLGLGAPYLTPPLLAPSFTYYPGWGASYAVAPLAPSFTPAYDTSEGVVEETTTTTTTTRRFVRP